LLLWILLYTAQNKLSCKTDLGKFNAFSTYARKTSVVIIFSTYK